MVRAAPSNVLHVLTRLSAAQIEVERRKLSPGVPAYGEHLRTSCKSV